jgi:teichuronic acid biosynthesis glycosyltransferase TuaC
MEPIKVLMITSEWPTPEHPWWAPFVVRQVQFLQRAGIDVEIFPFRGAKNPMNYLKTRIVVNRKLRQTKYDLVHAQFGQSSLLPWPKRLPLVVTFRGGDILGVKGNDGRTTVAGRILRHICRLVAMKADAVIVVSEHMKKHLPRSVRVDVLPSGLDFESLVCLSKTEARERLGLPQDERLILFAGNPELGRKRYGLASQAIDILNKRLPVRTIIGWNVPHSTIILMMNACDVLLFTSSDEGSPNVVKEALACNLPIVSVPVADVAQRLKGVDNCELCVDERPETLAAAVERVLERGQRTNGREAVQTLDENLITEKLIGIYRSILRIEPLPSTIRDEDKTSAPLELRMRSKGREAQGAELESR